VGLFDLIRSELIDIIEWIDDTQHTLVWRFPRHDNEIKNGAQLIVRPGQTAVFVYKGEIADIYPPGHYQLTTDNMPVMTTLQGWKYGFDSPFKAEVYFVSTRQLTDLKWGTPNPIMLRDPEFGPIRIRAFGTYALRAVDPKALLLEIVGTNGEFGADDVNVLLRSIIQSSFADLIGSSQIAALDLASNYEQLAAQLRERVVEKIDDEYGLDCPQLFIVNISLPESVEKALDTRTSMGVIGDMNRFQQFQMGQAMTSAAENGGGGGDDAWRDEPWCDEPRRSSGIRRTSSTPRCNGVVRRKGWRDAWSIHGRANSIRNWKRRDGSRINGLVFRNGRMVDGQRCSRFGIDAGRWQSSATATSELIETTDFHGHRDGIMTTE